MKFNSLAKKDGTLYNIIKERKCPVYIDRLQGGSHIDEYEYDEDLLSTYREMLGENFWGFQMHEWLSNYKGDLSKLTELDKNKWTKENIEKLIFKKFPTPCLFLECMTAEEMAQAGKPENVQDFCKNMMEIYRKRIKTHGELIPCDSYFLAYAFEIENGAKRIMPEVGAQTPDTRVQICYARGMAQAHGISFGTYYEPWGGSPFSACCYQKDDKNEWGIGDSEDFPFHTDGPNGGSSRSLQERIFIYSYMSGAEFISEEWGVCNVFTDWKNFELSPYGKVKKDFMEFTRKYRNVGKKITPIAAVLPKELVVLDDIRSPRTFCGYEISGKDGDMIEKAKNGVREIFSNEAEMIGTEKRNLINSLIPDAVDLLNDTADEALEKYDYLVDLTSDIHFKEKHKNFCTPDEIPSLLREILPCYVEGGLHWMVNECTDGGYYLTIFNNSGVVRSVKDGEYTLREADKTVDVFFKNNREPEVCEGKATLKKNENIYELTVRAGDWCLIKF